MKNEKFKSGVITGNDVKKLFKYAKYNNFAIPSVNCIGTDSINAVLEAANIMRSPIIIQFSYNGSAFIAGKGVCNKLNNKFLPSIIGSISGAMHIHQVAKYYDIPIMIHTDHCTKEMLPWLDGLLSFEEKYLKENNIRLFSSHMIDLSNENLIENILISSKYLDRMKNMLITLEIELGCTGGEEDGINNTNLPKELLYTNSKDILYAFDKLNKINNNFIIAASFGNVHGVYKPGNVKLNLNILKESQDLISNIFKIKKNPIDFVFHGGSGSSDNEIKESIKYGVVKMNIDTDIQWSSWNGILNYYNKNKLFLQSQLGNPCGDTFPNKKYYDPRSWIRESQIYIINELKKKFISLNSIKSV